MYKCSHSNNVPLPHLMGQLDSHAASLVWHIIGTTLRISGA
uniref:Uncharacterized protein n=1 Tax=Anguilla anguilla TaxID=7936 RepID=A0A0E9U6N0_ANGAN